MPVKPKRKVRFTPEQELAMLRNRQDLIAFVLGFKSWKALEQFSYPVERTKPRKRGER